MSYPIKVTQQSYDHKGGTKSYHFTMIEAADGRCVVVFRYGKKGQFGQLITATFETAKAAWKHYEAKENEKQKGGYTPIGTQSTKVAGNPTELPTTVGIALFNKIGGKAVNHIDTGYDTSKMRQEVDVPTLDEEGRKVGDTSRKADIKDLLAQQKAAEEELAARAYDDNEEYGIF
jgi:predicted DNA-binding WGR domain protein